MPEDDPHLAHHRKWRSDSFPYPMMRRVLNYLLAWSYRDGALCMLRSNSRYESAFLWAVTSRWSDHGRSLFLSGRLVKGEFIFLVPDGVWRDFPI